jgi:hypothetical protein
MNAVLLDLPPFQVRVKSDLPAWERHRQIFYPEHKVLDPSGFADFEIELLPGRGLRRWTQSRVRVDGHEPFLPLSAAHAGALFEWGLNWAVAQRPLAYLVMHAAVLERNGRLLMLPGFPGAGKSTLCASLAFLRQWRLFSDELTLYDLSSGWVHAHPRPISLKNASIARVAAMPGVRLGPVAKGTRKGDVAHAAAPPSALAGARQPARVGWVVFPKFTAGASREVQEISRVEAFTLIAEQSFHRDRLGESGFRALCDLLDGARCFQIGYGSTEDGLAAIDEVCSA